MCRTVVAHHQKHFGCNGASVKQQNPRVWSSRDPLQLPTHTLQTTYFGGGHSSVCGPTGKTLGHHQSFLVQLGQPSVALQSLPRSPHS
jgi:hypothetical protein